MPTLDDCRFEHHIVIDFPPSRSLIAVHNVPKIMAEPESDSSKPIAEISHGPSALEGFLDRHQKTLIGVGILTALGIGAAVVMQGMEEGAHQAGGEALLAADDIAAMQDVAKNHAGTPAADSAAVLLSDLQWEQGQQAAAIETLEAAIADAPDHPASAPAQARLGARLIDQGSLDRAEEVLQALADNSSAAYLAPYALTGLSEIAVAREDLEKAESLLEEASTSYPESPFGRTVSDHRRYVGFEMPTEIDPPAPEPVEEPTPGPGEEPMPPTIDPGPEPDLSKPIQLDPTGQNTSTGNPLLDSLNTGSAPGEQPEAPAEEPPAPTEETQAPAGESPAEEPTEATPPSDGE